jgi:hypothetical protein
MSDEKKDSPEEPKKMHYQESNDEAWEEILKPKGKDDEQVLDIYDKLMDKLSKETNKPLANLNFTLSENGEISISLEFGGHEYQDKTVAKVLGIFLHNITSGKMNDEICSTILKSCSTKVDLQQIIYEAIREWSLNITGDFQGNEFVVHPTRVFGITHLQQAQDNLNVDERQ